jgi:quercetin dioxygenase-like cupin family protein
LRRFRLAARDAVFVEERVEMSPRKGSGKARISFILPFILLVALSFSAVAHAQSESDAGIYQFKAIFNVPNPPSSPYHAHQSMLLFVPGAGAPLHYHGGPGYITVLQGELTLYEDGVQNVYQAGQSLIETTDKLYKGGNYGDEDMILMVTYLVPDGEDVTTVVDDPEAPEPPEIGPETLAMAMHEVAESPGSFDLIHTAESLPAGYGRESSVAQGDLLLTVVGGSLQVATNGGEYDVGAGEAIVIERDQEYRLSNIGDTGALFMSTELAPDVHSIVPAAGSTVDRTFATWLIVMTASMLLVVGGVLRLSAVRMR